jgi:hypothetical protein
MIRRATSDDAPAISDVFVRARGEMTYLPRIPEHERPAFVFQDRLHLVSNQSVVT